MKTMEEIIEIVGKMCKRDFFGYPGIPALIQSLTQEEIDLANAGDAIMQCYVGLYYFHDLNSREISREMLRSSAEQGNKYGEYFYARFLEMFEGGDEHLSYYKKSAEQGYAPARYILAMLYYADYGDYYESAPLFEELAEEEYSILKDHNSIGVLQYYAGSSYYRQMLTDDSIADAVRMFELSAENNYSKAQYMIGECYYLGEGYERDLCSAIRWYKKAIKNDKNGDAYRRIEEFKAAIEVLNEDDDNE